jgi:hypothetical protein
VSSYKRRQARANTNKKVHTRMRSEERYGQRLSRADTHEIVRLIKAGKCRLLNDAAAGRRVYEVIFRDLRWAVLYSPQRRELLTVLPSDHYLVQGRNVDPRLEPLQAAFEELKEEA